MTEQNMDDNEPTQPGIEATPEQPLKPVKLGVPDIDKILAEAAAEPDRETLRKQWRAEASKQTLDTLPAFLKKLSEEEHTYDTIVLAIASAAQGAAWAIEHSPNGGITGFQAGGVMWEFIRGWMSFDQPMRLLKFEEMLYPQYAYHFDRTISSETWQWLQDEAKKRLSERADRTHLSESVKAHWQSIADGVVPFGFTVKDN